MKKLIIACAFLIISTFAFGQQMVIGLELEYTVSGPQLGNSILYETGKQWGAGAFYQSGITTTDDRSERSHFYGTHFQVPLVKADRISLLGTVRAGLVMDKFFVVVPGLETRINIRKHLALAFSMSPRKAYPAVAAKLVIKLFNR